MQRPCHRKARGTYRSRSAFHSVKGATGWPSWTRIPRQTLKLSRGAVCLWAAVLLDALRTLQRTHNPELWRETMEWVNTRDPYGNVPSLDGLCLLFDLLTEEVRTDLNARAENSPAAAVARREGRRHPAKPTPAHVAA